MNTKEQAIYISESLNIKDQCIQCIEKCAELQQALSKLYRFYGNNRPANNFGEISNNIQEEVADVMVAIDVLKHSGVINMTEVNQIANTKLNRWVQRLNNDWSE